MSACPHESAHEFFVSCYCGYRSPAAVAAAADVPTEAEIIAHIRGLHRPYVYPRCPQAGTRPWATRRARAARKDRLDAD